MISIWIVLLKVDYFKAAISVTYKDNIFPISWFGLWTPTCGINQIKTQVLSINHKCLLTKISLPPCSFFPTNKLHNLRQMVEYRRYAYQIIDLSWFSWFFWVDVCCWPSQMSNLSEGLVQSINANGPCFYPLSWSLSCKCSKCCELSLVMVSGI